MNIDVKKVLEIGLQNRNLEKFILSKFPKSKYFSSDIAFELLKNSNSTNNKVCFDHDEWVFDKNIFNLIISNNYLQFSNNFELLLQNLNFSLNKNGFLLATVLGSNSLKELKECMMMVDLEKYGGVYQRFFKSLSVEEISNVLKKCNYKIPLIDIDIIEIRYKKFYNLMNDIRSLGLSNIYIDRKNSFENKKYFHNIEETYRKKFFDKNEFISTLEVIYISGWKEDESQQKPLKPGQAKISLKEVLN